MKDTKYKCKKIFPTKQAGFRHPNLEHIKKPINKKVWERKRNTAIKTGCLRPRETQIIKLKITKKEIEEEIKKNENNHYLHLADGFGDTEHIIWELRTEVYMKKCKNNKKDLLNAIYQYENTLRKQFPKLYWEEYQYFYDMEYQSINDKQTYNKFKKRAKFYDELRKYLDNHLKIHGACGMDRPTLPKKFDGFWSRGWGAMMSAYMNSKEGKRKYDYMSFYM